MSGALFTPITVGDIKLEHRVAMAPLTRFRANGEHEHVSVAVEYYTQRCHTPGTLIITEATFISEAAGGYPNVPGVYTDAQVEAWKTIVDAVHAKGCFIYMQLWALGRAAVKDVLAPLDVVSASDIPFEGGAVPRALTIPEIKAFTADYATAAKNFVERAGGDGVEIHGANGYLLDQFLQTKSNKRTDAYGGSVENRARFALEVVDAVVAAVGVKKTGIRLSPYSTFQDMKMPMDDIKSTYTYYVNAMRTAHTDMAYIHVVESRIAGNTDITKPVGEDLDFIYDLWTPRTFLVAGGFNSENGPVEAETRKNTVVVYGRWFISNPDLVSRIKNNVPLAAFDRATFYVYGPQNTAGYTDYPIAASA